MSSQSSDLGILYLISLVLRKGLETLEKVHDSSHVSEAHIDRHAVTARDTE